MICPDDIESGTELYCNCYEGCGAKIICYTIDDSPIEVDDDKVRWITIDSFTGGISVYYSKKSLCYNLEDYKVVEKPDTSFTLKGAL